METTILYQVIKELKTYKHFFGQKLPAQLTDPKQPLQNFSTIELDSLVENLEIEQEKFVRLDKGSHTFLQSILNQFPFYIFWKDSNLVYRGCNQNFADSFNLSIEEIKGKSDYDLYESDRIDYNIRQEQEVLLKGIRKDDLRKEQDKDGTLKVINSITIPLYNEVTEIIGILGFSWSRSDGGPNIQKLRQESEEYKRRVENSRQIYLEFNRRGYITYANKTIEKILFYPVENLIGLDVKHLIAEQDWANLEQLKEHSSQNNSLPFIIHFKRKNSENLRLIGDFRATKNGFALEMQYDWPETRQVINAMSCNAKEVNHAFDTIISLQSVFKNKWWDKLTGQEKRDFIYAVDATMNLRRALKESQNFLRLYENATPKSIQDLNKLLDAARTLTSANIAGYVPELRYDILPSLEVFGQNMIAFFEKMLEIGSQLSDDFKKVHIDLTSCEEENHFEFTLRYENCNQWKRPKEQDVFKLINERETFTAIPGLGQLLISCEFIITKHSGLIHSSWEDNNHLLIHFSLPK